MESKRKRSFLEEIEDDESDISKQKKVRFPKGKKVKTGDETVDRSKAEEEGPSERKDPRLAAKERALLRNEITAQIFCEDTNDASAAEVAYEENENFVEDGILIEPFNLEKEKEEGYFDAEGNFVEYIIQNEIKDAWLDSIQVDPRYTGKNSMVGINEHDDKDDVPELSSKEIGAMKKRIANLLEPGETVLQALRRLKGRSNKSKEKMSTETQLLFDQLTEDASKLLNHGEYNVYYDKQEVFRREAEGYERLALARGEGMSISEARGDYDFSMEKDLSFGVTDRGATSSMLPEMDTGTSIPNASTAEISGNDGDAYDMFGDDEDNAIAVASSDISNLVPGTESNVAYQPSSDGLNAISGTGPLQNDYVYDETSGYYYNSSLGYYYDPSTRLFCQATSGQWYLFNEETGTYNEIHEVASNAN
uniref:OCRE domain-containing protein n=1 Tax=Salix viminalis TaxID=40686 RepID=A0A6N2MPM6_SALVM